MEYSEKLLPRRYQEEVFAKAQTGEGDVVSVSPVKILGYKDA